MLELERIAPSSADVKAEALGRARTIFFCPWCGAEDSENPAGCRQDARSLADGTRMNALNEMDG